MIKIGVHSFLLGLFPVLMASGCFDRTATSPTMAELRSEREPVNESWGTYMDISEDGRPRARITAEYMARYETEDSTYTELHSEPDSGRQVIVQIFDANGDSTARITTDRLTQYEDNERFEARGNVRVDTPDNGHIETEHLIWLEADRKVLTSDFVRITTPDEQLQGFDLEAVEDLSSFKLKRPTGQVTVKE